MRNRYQAGAAMLLLCLWGCAASTAHNPGPRFNQEDHGRHVKVETGTRFSLVLKANPSTGFEWEQTSGDPRIAEPIGKPRFEPQARQPGAPGQRIFRFEAKQNGMTRLAFIYHRPWENKAPAKTFAMELEVG